MNNGMPDMNPGMSMPNMDINMGIFPPAKGGFFGMDINHIADKVHHLEREVKKLERRVESLEGGHSPYPTPLKHYDDGADYGMMKEYPQYHSGNYML